MSEIPQVIHEVYYGAHPESVGWVEEGTMLSDLHRDIAEAVDTGRARWVGIFSAGRGITSLLVTRGIPIYTRAKTFDDPLQ